MAKKKQLRITKKQIDATLASGVTHAFLTNKSVNRRMVQTNKDFARKKQIEENKARKNEKLIEKNYQHNQAQLAKQVSENALSKFEAEVSQFSSDMGATSHHPETFPVIDSVKGTHFVDSLDVPC